MTLPNLEAFLEKKKRISDSPNTIRTYLNTLRKWDSYVDTQQLITKSQDEIYEAIDNFVGLLIKEEFAPNTILSYISTIRVYLKHNKVRLDNEEFDDKVQLPKQRRINIDRAPEIDEVFGAIQLSRSLTIQTAIEMLASSGMRIGELGALKYEYIDFRYNRIRLPAEITKDRQERVTFYSFEAKEYLDKYIKEYIGARTNGYIFSIENLGEKPVSVNYLSNQIREAFKRTGKNKLNKQRYELHAHALRKFFYSRSVGIIGEAYAHALMGHKRYLDTYLGLSPEKQYSIYQQIEEAVSPIAAVNNNLQMTKKLTKEFNAAIEKEREKASSAVSKEDFDKLTATVLQLEQVVKLNQISYEIMTPEQKAEADRRLREVVQPKLKT